MLAVKKIVPRKSAIADGSPYAKELKLMKQSEIAKIIQTAKRMTNRGDSPQGAK